MLEDEKKEVKRKKIHLTGKERKNQTGGKVAWIYGGPLNCPGTCGCVS